MEWRQTGAGIAVGVRQVTVRSLRVPDETARSRRLRVCTAWKPAQEEFSRTPATARLVRTADRRIGVLITGRHHAYVKVGKRFLVTDRLIVPFNMLARTAVRKLIHGTDVSLEEIDGVVFAYDRQGDERIERTDHTHSF